MGGVSKDEDGGSRVLWSLLRDGASLLLRMRSKRVSFHNPAVKARRVSWGGNP
jgi:hypothetical protein